MYTPLILHLLLALMHHNVMDAFNGTPNLKPVHLEQQSEFKPQHKAVSKQPTPVIQSNPPDIRTVLKDCHLKAL
jgi:hypothetical protein